MDHDNHGSIAVLLPAPFGVRNVVYSGILESLTTAGVRVHLLLKHCPPALETSRYPEFRHAASCAQMLEANGKQVVGRAFLNGVIQKAFTQRHGINSYALYRQWFERDHSRPARLRSAAIETIGAASRPALSLRTLKWLSEQMYRAGYDLQPFRRTLRNLAPDLLWSTTCSSPFEYPYVLAAKDLGIPVVASILSFDNLTSRAAFPIYDHYLVWNERMRGQLLKFYPSVSPGRISVTGTPQFDFHRDPQFSWSRAKTLDQLGLDPGTNFFLYAASDESLAPEEPGLVSQIANRMSRDALLNDYRLVVRLHPNDDGSRWSNLNFNSAKVVTCQAYGSNTKPIDRMLSTREDHALLISSLLHAAACLNIVSTISLDAAILDRPVIGIDFRNERNSPREIMYEEYETDHYRPLVESGGLELAKNWDQLITLMRRALSEPEADRQQRALMVERECGRVDGRARERVVETLLELLKDHVRCRDTHPLTENRISIPKRNYVTQ